MTSFETEELSCSRNSVRVHNDDDAYDEDDDDDYDDSDDDVDYDEDSEDDSADEDDSDDEHEADDNVGQTETAIEDIVEKLEAMIIEETAKLEGLIGLGQDQLPLQESPKYGEDPEDTFIVTIKDLSGRSVVEPEDVNSILEDNGDDVVVLFGQDFSLARRHNHKVHSTGKGKRKRKAKGKRKAGERVDGEEVDTGEEETDEDEDDHFRSNQSHGDDDDDDDDNNDDDNDNAGQDGEEDDRGEGQEPSNNDHHHGMDKDRAKAKAKDKDKDKENSKNKDKHSSSHDDKLKHQDQQRQNANLGSTGGNGPILLCSSRSCLPGLRDSILSKISVQIHQVLTHLNNQEILLHMMEDTAPQTKESLIAGQEELVQQLEDGIMRDLKDWVNGAGSYSHNEEKKNKETEESSSAGDVPSKEKSNNVDTVSAASAPSSASTSEHDDNNVDNDDNDDMKNAEITVEFLGGDDGYESQVGNMGGFQMVGLDLEDEDDDDEDHEFDSHNTASDKKKQAHPRQPSKHSNHKDDTITQLVKRAEGNKGSSTSTSAGGRISDNSGSQEYFLSADILLMRQEWSRWIVHWVHHTKLLILSHTLARRTLTDMNQIAISGGNVVSQDQRHWAWNLDKALATVMVASEMLCGGRSEPKAVVDFLSTLSVAGETMRRPSLMTPQSVELTANAQKCIEAWRQDLEDILKRTATVA
ncbi:hypothetical protein BGX28_004192 [Mortierella sp. GBA30]|nr:hypothetical protein BGX28_004192 [Mortierella sp. GBA30]